MESVIKGVSSVVIARRISVVTKDGGHHHRLGVKRAAEFINQRGGDAIPVTVDDSPEAESQLRSLAGMTGMGVEKVEDGFLLAQAKREDAQQREDPRGEEDPGPVEARGADPVEDGERVEDPEPVGVPSTAAVPEETDIDEIAEEAQEAPPDAMSRRGLIVIGPNDVFTSAEDALSRLREWERQDHPEISPRYHQGLTKTFHNGSPHGQIISVYKDVRKYGMLQVYGKAKAFKDLVMKSEAVEFEQYKKFLRNKFLPHDARTHSQPGRVDMAYFKLWAMFILIKDEAERQRVERNRAA